MRITFQEDTDYSNTLLCIQCQNKQHWLFVLYSGPHDNLSVISLLSVKVDAEVECCTWLFPDVGTCTLKHISTFMIQMIPSPWVRHLSSWLYFLNRRWGRVDTSLLCSRCGSDCRLGGHAAVHLSGCRTATHFVSTKKKKSQIRVVAPSADLREPPN